MNIKEFFDSVKPKLKPASENLINSAKKSRDLVREFFKNLDPQSIRTFVTELPSRFKRNSKKKYSLMTWLSISFTSFSLIIIVLLLLFQTLFFGSFYKAIKTKNLTTSADSIMRNINDPNISDFIDQTSVRNDVDAILSTHDVYANYKTLYSAIQSNSCKINSFDTREFNEYFVLARNNGGSYITVIDEPEEDLPRHTAERLIYAASFLDENGTEYLLLLESVITPSMNVQQTLSYQLNIITIVLIVISITMTVIFSRMIAKPLQDLNRSAKELGEGDYDVVFNGGGYREVEQLSETLNYAKNELQQVDQMRKDLIANVSHDLRTPLTLISGYGEIIRDIPGENTAENVQIIIDESNRLTSLVNDLIDISKIEAGTMKLEASVFCITDTIRDMFGRYNKLKEQDGFSFTLESDQQVYVYADQLKISQVIYNLVNNAVNYAGESKEITVRQICYDNRVRIEVIDNGPGIPQDKLKNIWDRYYKVDKSHSSARIGTGLGLSIVKTVLKLHKAQYGVFSKVGKGTVFWFELYRTDENGEPL